MESYNSLSFIDDETLMSLHGSAEGHKEREKLSVVGVLLHSLLERDISPKNEAVFTLSEDEKIVVQEAAYIVPFDDLSYLHVLAYKMSQHEGATSDIDTGVYLSEYDKNSHYLGGYKYCVTANGIYRYINFIDDPVAYDEYFSLISVYNDVFGHGPEEEYDLAEVGQGGDDASFIDDRVYQEMTALSVDPAVAEGVERQAWRRDSNLAALGLNEVEPSLNELYKLEALLRDVQPFRG